MRRRVLPFAILLAGCASEPAKGPATATAPTTAAQAVPERWTTYTDTARAFRIRFPASWRRSARVLAPALSNPHEILSLSTHRARPGGENCGHVPENAMRDLGEGDVLLTLQERRGSGGFEERVRPYRLPPVLPAPSNECAERTDIALGQDGFRDAGRGLHVLAAFGPGAEERRRREVERVVESLELDPAWRSRRLALRLQPPTGWHVRASGRQLVLGSFRVLPPPAAACRRPRSLAALPRDGALIHVFEYRGLNRTQRMRFPSFPRFRLLPAARRSYECAGFSWLFRWRDEGRVFQAHVYLGRRAGAARRAETLAALRSIAVVRR